MAITGISALSGQQIIAVGATSARSAATASYTTGGDDLQQAYTTLSTRSGIWDAKGDMHESAFSYDGNNEITAYNGSAFKAGDEFPQSATDAIIVVTGNSANWNDVSSKLDSTAFSTVSGSFLTAHQSLPESATWNTVTSKLDTTAFSTVSGSFLTAHQSLPDSANWNSTYTTVNTNSGSWSGRPQEPVSGINIDIFESDGKVVFSGMAGGGSVPEGVMIESGLEYNAVNEISGYSGSAFAQYGAEKQWLQHDDTLLHVANSAQYALGVNLSAVAQLLGVDETVLWSGTAAPSNFPLTMSEPFSAFEKIEFVWDTRYNGDYGTPTKGTIVYTDNHGSTVPTKYTLVEAYANASQTWWDWWYLENDNNGTALSNLKAIYYPMTGGNSAAQTNCRLFKVIGIGRKEV